MYAISPTTPPCIRYGGLIHQVPGPGPRPRATTTTAFMSRCFLPRPVALPWLLLIAQDGLASSIPRSTRAARGGETARLTHPRHRHAHQPPPSTCREHETSSCYLCYPERKSTPGGCGDRQQQAGRQASKPAGESEEETCPACLLASLAHGVVCFFFAAAPHHGRDGECHRWLSSPRNKQATCSRQGSTDGY